MFKTLDWLQFSLRIKEIPNNSLIDYMSFVKSEKQTAIFSELYEIFIMENRVATMVYKSKNPIIPADLGIVKIDNKYLYEENIYVKIIEICQMFGGEFNNWTRVDIAIDFQEMECYKNPGKLIYDYMREKIILKNKCNYSINGKNNTRNKANGITFGSGTSNVKVRMYNKTEEMKDVKPKEWIKECWRKKRFKRNIDTWRLEFQINNFNMSITDKETGECESIKSIRNPSDFLRDFFIDILINQYFTFVKLKFGQRKDRAEKIKLFNNTNTTQKLIYVAHYQEGSKTDKVFIKKIDQTMEELRGINSRILSNLNIVKEIYIHRHSLSEWYERKSMMLGTSGTNRN